MKTLMAVLEIRKDLTAEQRRERADELIDEFNIGHIRDSLGQSLLVVNVVVWKLHAP